MPRDLIKPANEKMGKRLKELRENRKLSLYRLVKQLNPLVSIQLEGKSGETRISRIENSDANLTVELAIAYSKIFDVSLEYLFCVSSDMQPENKPIKEVLGLTDIAISKIKDFSNGKNSETKMKILNTLFESDLLLELVHNLDSFIFTNQFYNSCETLPFDCRYEDDTEVVKLLPRWRFEKSVSTLIEKIIVLFEKDEHLMLHGE